MFGVLTSIKISASLDLLYPKQKFTTKTKEVFAVDAMNWYGASESGVPSKAARIESGQHQGGGESNVFFLLLFFVVVVFCLYLL